MSGGTTVTRESESSSISAPMVTDGWRRIPRATKRASQPVAELWLRRTRAPALDGNRCSLMARDGEGYLAGLGVAAGARNTW